MNIVEFDLNTLDDTRRYWVESAIKLGLDDDLIELNEQFFELISKSGAYGTYSNRESLNTYLGIKSNESSDIDVIVEVSFHRRGREYTLKIMDVYISPQLDSSTETEYHLLYAQYLTYIVQTFLNDISTSSGSATKIYARTNNTQAFLQLMHEAAVQMKEEFDKVGISVQFEGKRWLAFRRT